MPITKRTLEKWRMDALRERETISQFDGTEAIRDPTYERIYVDDLHHRILLLTQELLDQHLLRKESK